MSGASERAVVWQPAAATVRTLGAVEPPAGWERIEVEQVVPFRPVGAGPMVPGGLVWGRLDRTRRPAVAACRTGGCVSAVVVPPGALAEGGDVAPAAFLVAATAGLRAVSIIRHLRRIGATRGLVIGAAGGTGLLLARLGRQCGIELEAVTTRRGAEEELLAAGYGAARSVGSLAESQLSGYCAGHSVVVDLSGPYVRCARRSSAAGDVVIDLVDVVPAVLADVPSAMRLVADLAARLTTRGLEVPVHRESVEHPGERVSLRADRPGVRILQFRPPREGHR